MDDFLAKKRPVPILGQDNYERWFKLLERYFKGEGLWPAVVGAPMTDIEGLDKADAKAQYYIDICVGDMDRERIEECNSAKEMWHTLLRSYTKKRPSVGRQYLRELTTYQMPENGSIQDAWTDIQRLTRHVKAINPGMKDAFNQSQMFQQLLASLPPAYNTIRDAIDGQGEHDIDVLMQRLLEKESLLKADAKAFVMRTQHQPSTKSSSTTYHHRPSREFQPRRRLSSPEEKPIAVKCFACKGDHKWRSCPHIEENMDEIRAILVKARMRRRNGQRSKAKAHMVERIEMSSEDSTVSIDEVDTAFSANPEALSGKSPITEWIADTGASAHMTDQLHLFRGPLKKVARGSVRAGGDVRLSIKGIGNAQVQTKGGAMNLSGVLYVPDLGVNLLSGTALCEKGLRGSFDKRALYMHDRKGSLVLKAVKQGGIYIVNRIAPNLGQSAYPTAIVTADPHTSLGVVQQSPEPYAQPDDPENPDIAETRSESEIVESAKPNGRHRKDDSWYRLWHKRFAHMGEEKLKSLHKVTTLQKAIHKPKEIEPCEVCALTKMRNRTNARVSERKTNLLDLVSIDICGPLPIALSGARYFLEAVDNHTRKTWVMPLRSRLEAKPTLEKWKRNQELLSRSKLKAVRSDNATELKNILDEWCLELGIQAQYTIPYTSSQNGVAERHIQTTENNTRAMLKDADLPIELWDEAAMAECYLRNRTAVGPKIDNQRITPEEAWTGIKPSIDHVRIWGCKCYSYVNPKSLPASGRQDKLMDRGRVAVFVGYEENTTKQWRVYAPDLGYIIRTSVVTFDESQKGGTVDLRVRTTSNTLPDRNPRGRPRKEPVEPAAGPPFKISSDRSADQSASGPSLDIMPKSAVVPLDRNPDRSADQSGQSETIPAPAKKFLWVEIPKRSEATLDTEGGRSADLSLDSAPKESIKEPASTADEEQQADRSTDHSADIDDPQEPESSSRDVGRLQSTHAYELNPVTGKRGRDSDDDEGEYNLRNRKVHRAFPAQYQVSIPKTYREAVEDPTFGAEWFDAIEREKTALQANGTWEEVVAPDDANIISSRWVFAVKYSENGGIEKFKARLVARGFSQRYGIDYQDTFAPTMRMDSLRVLLALVAIEDLECHQIDVNNAFTESVNTELIYMSAPDGVQTAKGRVLKVLKSLYGLKQAARDWYDCMTKGLEKLGFQPTPADPCIFVNGKGLIIGTWVDDLAIAGSNLSDVEKFKAEFGMIFKIKDLGEIKKILGIKITRNRSDKTIFLSQSSYIEKILSELKMEQDSHRAQKQPITGYDALIPASQTDERTDPKVYQQFIGSITYAMTTIRPDIAFAVNKLAQYMSDPASYHQGAVKHILRYLRSTKDMRIRYGPENPNLIGYSDADYGGDKSDRKSTTANVFLLGGGAVSWLSRKQRSVSTSTTEAEYVAMSTCAKQGVWLSQLLRDVGYAQYLGESPWTVNILGDNQSSLALIRNPQIHERSKHIDICYHNVRDREKRGQIKLDYVGTEEMAADGLTKPLTGPIFEKNVYLLGLRVSSEVGM